MLEKGIFAVTHSPSEIELLHNKMSNTFVLVTQLFNELNSYIMSFKNYIKAKTTIIYPLIISRRRMMNDNHSLKQQSALQIFHLFIYL